MSRIRFHVNQLLLWLLIIRFIVQNLFSYFLGETAADEELEAKQANDGATPFADKTNNE